MAGEDGAFPVSQKCSGLEFACHIVRSVFRALKDEFINFEILEKRRLRPCRKSFIEGRDVVLV